MSIIKYKAFTKIAELGSYSAAAKALGYSQPGIHHMISSLEQELGHSLLTCHDRQIIPTAFGHSILEYAYQISKSADFIKETATLEDHSNNMKVITIGSYNSMLISLIPEILGYFHKAHADVTFRIKELKYNECLTALAHHEVDFCFMSDAHPESYYFLPLLEDPAVLIMQRSHPLATLDKIPISALDGHDILMYFPESDDIVATIMQIERFTPHNHFCITTDTPSHGLIRSCNAVGILSSLELVKLMNDLTCKDFDIDIHRNLGIVSTSSKLNDPILQDFLSISKTTSEVYCRKNGLKTL